MIGTISGGRKLRDVALALRKAGATDLRRELTAALKRAPEPVVKDLKAAVEKVPVVGFPAAMGAARRNRSFTMRTPAKNLRVTIARVIESQVTTSGSSPKLTIRVNAARLPASIQSLPRYLDASNRKGWRHPVMGNRQVWVNQQGKKWWWPTIEPHLKNIRAEVDTALDHVREQIERST
jgi:hypothetical protein